MARTAIAVIGGSDSGAEVCSLARALGAEIVRRGCHLVCGGRGGVMEAACKGARECPDRGGAVTVGILPGGDPGEGNEYLDLVIPTGMGLTRNALVVLSGQAVIAVDGGAETLSEMALAWQFDRPVVALAPSGGWASRLAGTALDHKSPRKILSASTPEEAVDLALAQLVKG